MKRTITTLLLVMSLVMVLMAPATASRSITEDTLASAGWFWAITKWAHTPSSSFLRTVASTRRRLSILSITAAFISPSSTTTATRTERISLPASMTGPTRG